MCLCAMCHMFIPSTPPHFGHCSEIDITVRRRNQASIAHCARACIEARRGSRRSLEHGLSSLTLVGCALGAMRRRRCITSPPPHTLARSRRPVHTTSCCSAGVSRATPPPLRGAAVVQKPTWLQLYSQSRSCVAMNFATCCVLGSRRFLGEVAR